MGTRRVVSAARFVAPSIFVPIHRRMKKQEKQSKQSAARTAELEAAEAKRESEVSAASEEAKLRSRRKTVFAGGDIERNIFRQTLGGGSGTTQKLGA